MSRKAARTDPIRKDDVQREPPHGIGCSCGHCRLVCCIACPAEHRDIVWVGLPGYGKHLRDAHPAEFARHYRTHTISGRPRDLSSGVGRHVRLRERASAALREVRAIEEIAKAETSGLRSVPIEVLTETQLSQVNAWVAATKKLPRLREKLFLEAVERVDDHFRTADAYRRALRSLQALVEEASAANSPTVVTKPTAYDPRVAIELTKLSYALGRGWSFTVHLVALYGIKAIVEGLRREGIVPPRGVAEVPSPSIILDADEARQALIARTMRMTDDPNVLAFGFPDDLDDDILEDERDETHRRDAANV